MPIAPPPRRRATIIDGTPSEPVYITEARKFIVANKSKNSFAAIEKAAKLECHKAMAAAEVGSFDITVDDVVYEAVIAGGTENSVSVPKLYKMVTDKKITMEQFLKCVGATQGAVKAELGTNALATVLESTPKEADLSIGKKKKA